MERMRDSLKYNNKTDDNSGMPKRRNSVIGIIGEQRILHEAYQIVLAEHHRQLKKRTKQKLLAINSLISAKPSTSQPSVKKKPDKTDRDDIGKI